MVGESKPREMRPISQLEAGCLQARYHIRRQVWEAKRKLNLTDLTFEAYLATLPD